MVWIALCILEHRVLDTVNGRPVTTLDGLVLAPLWVWFIVPRLPSKICVRLETNPVRVKCYYTSISIPIDVLGPQEQLSYPLNHSVPGAKPSHGRKRRHLKISLTNAHLPPNNKKSTTTVSTPFKGTRSYPESNRGRPDSPDSLLEAGGIRTGSDNRYTIEPCCYLMRSPICTILPSTSRRLAYGCSKSILIDGIVAGSLLFFEEIKTCLRDFGQA